MTQAGHRAEAAQSDAAPESQGFGQSIALNLAGRFGYLIIGFVGSIALARFLGPADRGLLGVMISVSSLTLVIVGIGVPLATVYYSSRADADHGALLGNAIGQAIAISVVLVPLAALFFQRLADSLGAGRGGRDWILAACLVPIVFLDWTTHAQLQGMFLFKRFNVLFGLSRLSYVGAIFLFAGLAGLNVAAGLLATALGSIVMVAGSLRPILERGGAPRLDVSQFMRVISYGQRIQIGAIFQLANGRLDVLVLQAFRPLRQVGYYVVAQTIAEIAITVATAFQASLMPFASRTTGRNATETTFRAIRNYSVLGSTAVATNAFLGTTIIYFGFGRSYRAAIVPMLLLTPGIWFLGLGTVIQGDLSGRGRPGLSSLLSGLAALVTVGLDLALIPSFGVVGAASASVVAYTTFGTASAIALQRLTHHGWKRLLLPTREDVRAYSRAATTLGRALKERFDL